MIFLYILEDSCFNFGLLVDRQTHNLAYILESIAIFRAHTVEYKRSEGGLKMSASL